MTDVTLVQDAWGNTLYDSRTSPHGIVVEKKGGKNYVIILGPMTRLRIKHVSTQRFAGDLFGSGKESTYKIIRV